MIQSAQYRLLTARQRNSILLQHVSIVVHYQILVQLARVCASLYIFSRSLVWLQDGGGYCIEAQWARDSLDQHSHSQGSGGNTAVVVQSPVGMRQRWYYRRWWAVGEIWRRKSRVVVVGS